MGGLAAFLSKRHARKTHAGEVKRHGKMKEVYPDTDTPWDWRIDLYRGGFLRGLAGAASLPVPLYWDLGQF